MLRHGARIEQVRRLTAMMNQSVSSRYRSKHWSMQASCSSMLLLNSVCLGFGARSNTSPPTPRCANSSGSRCELSVLSWSHRATRWTPG